MKKLSIALAMAIAASAAVAADKVETAKKAPVKMSVAEMSKIVAGASANDTKDRWALDTYTTCGSYESTSYDCNPSGKYKEYWNNKGN